MSAINVFCFFFSAPVMIKRNYLNQRSGRMRAAEVDASVPGLAKPCAPLFTKIAKLCVCSQCVE